jgi:MoaF C-terminal domain
LNKRVLNKQSLMGGPPDLAFYRLPRSTALDGQRFELDLSSRDRLVLDIDASWDVVEVAPGTWFADKDTGPHQAQTAILSLATGWGLVIGQRRDPAVSGRGPAVTHSFRTGLIGEPAGDPPAPTRDLVGRWHRYRYSPADLYEHIYVSGDRFVSHNVDTVHTSDRADCHPVSYYKVAPDLYLVAWREFDSQASMIMAENLSQFRATGKVLHPESAASSVSRPIGGFILPATVTFPISEEAR